MCRLLSCPPVVRADDEGLSAFAANDNLVSHFFLLRGRREPGFCVPLLTGRNLWVCDTLPPACPISYLLLNNRRFTAQIKRLDSVGMGPVNQTLSANPIGKLSTSFHLLPNATALMLEVAANGTLVFGLVGIVLHVRVQREQKPTEEAFGAR